MARSAEEVPSDPALVVTNPEEDCSEEAFKTFVAELLSGPEPDVDSLGAAEALQELRSDAHK